MQDAHISFTKELLDVADAFLARYEDQRPLETDMERALVLSYVLGVMRSNLDAISDALAESGVMGTADPRVLFDECATEGHAEEQHLRQEAKDHLSRRGWIGEA